MSTYHLQARRFEGTLCAPRRNDLEADESDDYAAIVTRCREMVGRGFTVWLYEHGPVRMANGEGAYRVIAQFSPARE